MIMKKTITRMGLLLIFLCVTMFTNAQEPFKIGDEFNVDVSTKSLYKSTKSGVVLEKEFHKEGSGYVKIHFRNFDLAAGDYVEIYSPETGESIKYTGKGKFVMDGTSQISDFWSASIWSDRAIVKFFINNQSNNYGFDIDRVAYGYSKDKIKEIFSNELKSICGNDDKEWAKCYEGTAMYEKAKAVSRLYINGSSACTGWLLGSDGHLMTNNHCIDNQSTADNTEYEFMGEGSSCNTSCTSWLSCRGPIEATSGTLVKTNSAYDYSLIKLPGNLSNTYGYLSFRSTLPSVGERIYIPQHPGAKGKQISVYDDQGNDNSKVNSIGTDVEYYADTEGGSSGSPVIAYSDNLVVALHHYGGCTNSGVRNTYIINDLGSLMPSNGVDSQTGNIPPTANANGPYVADPGQTISFSSAGSSDTDGSIASYYWDFGDGNTSSQANPNHTYTNAGNYDVTLTVTDNEGATGTDNTTAAIGDVCNGLEACSGVVKLQLITDRYASETTWTLKNSAGTTIDSNPSLSNSTTYNTEWNLDEGEYTFTINDTYGDGICCGYGNGSFTITDGCDAVLGSGGDFGSLQQVVFCAGEKTNSVPTAEANGPYNGYKDNAINFSSTGSGDTDGTITYFWEFGDGGTSTDANPSHTYTTAGVYTATLTVTDNDGATASDNAEVTVTDPPACIDVTLTINLDNYPEETSWEIKNSSGTIVASGGTYGSMPDGSTFTETNCLEAGSYTLTIYDSYGDGLCCNYGIGSYELKDVSGTVLASGGSFGSSESTNFTLGTEGVNAEGIVRQNFTTLQDGIFPNPTKDFLNIRLAKGYVVSAEIITISGKAINVEVNKNKIDVSHLKPGVYFISVKSNIGKKLKVQFSKE